MFSGCELLEGAWGWVGNEEGAGESGSGGGGRCCSDDGGRGMGKGDGEGEMGQWEERDKKGEKRKSREY